jgi:hypothetical protein
MTNVRLEVKVIPDMQESSQSVKKLQLDKHDIHDVFSKYGQIVNISIENDSCVAIVTFADILEAFIAKTELHDMRLTRDLATLHVAFTN